MSFIDAHRTKEPGGLRWGVEPICAVLESAPTTYWSAKTRPPCARKIRDADLAEECFGPLVVVARYTDASEIDVALRRIPASLTTTIHLDDADRAFYESIADAMTATSGRVVFNGFPTGVRVSWAQQHGGPWPATNTQHTSVGVTAVRRFMRPVAYQNAPEWALPAGLRDGDIGIPRRVNGVLTTEA